jgi:TP901 family phage tail tape measure protein
MPGKNTIRIDLVVDSKGAVTGVKQASGAVDQLGTSSKGAGMGFAALTASFISAQVIMAGVSAAFRTMVGAISGSIDSARSFQDAFTGVLKTVEGTPAQFAKLEEGFRQMAVDIPIAVESLLEVGEAAGQLGIPTDRILEFTETAAMLGVTTNLSAQDASVALARLANVTGGVTNTNFQALGSTLVGLGNNFATTESEILMFGQRIAATGDIIGLSQAEILGFGAALSSVGLLAEAGSTAIQRTFITINDAVKSGGEELEIFAKVAEQSLNTSIKGADGFRKAFEEDAANATVAFIEGLDQIQQQGGNVFAILESLGLSGVRTGQALLSAAKAGDELRRALDLANETFALTDAFTQLEGAVSDAIGGSTDQLEAFAGVVGMSADEFQKAFEERPREAVKTFVEALQDLKAAGGDVESTLASLGFTNEDVVDTMMNLADQTELSAEQFALIDSLGKEAELRFGTFSSQLELTGNAWNDLAIEVGNAIVQNQALGEVMKFIREIIVAVTDAFKNNKESITKLVSGGLVFLVGALNTTIDVFQFFIKMQLDQINVITTMARAWADFTNLIVDASVALGLMPESMAGTIKGITDMAIGMDEYVDKAREVVGSGGAVDQFQVGLDGLINKMTDATGKQLANQDSLDRMAEASRNAGEGAKQGGEGVADLGDKAEKTKSEVEKLTEAFSKLSTGQIKTDMLAVSQAINNVGGAASLNKEQLETAAKSIERFREAGLTLTPTLQEVEQRLVAMGLDERSKEIQKMADQFVKLGKAAKIKEADKLLATLQKMGGVANLNKSQIMALGDAIEDLGLEAADVPPELQEIIDKMNELESQGIVASIVKDMKQLSGVVSSEGRQAFDQMRAAMEQLRAEGFEPSNEAIIKMSEELDRLAETDPGLRDEIAAVKDEFDIAHGSAVDFGATIEGLADLFMAFGIDAQSSLGGIIQGFSMLGAALPAMTDFNNSILGDKGLSGMDKLQAGIGAAAQGFSSLMSATASGGAGASAAKGALSGASTGAAIGGPIGAGIGAAVGGIVGFFRGRGRDKLRKEIESAVGATVSEGLADAIKQAAKEMDISVADAALLNLSDIFGEVGIEGFEGGLGGAADAVTTLMTKVADGSIDAKKGVQEIGEAFSIMASEVYKAGEVADAEFINLIQNQRELGLEVPEIAAFVADQLKMAAEGINKFVGGIQIVDIEDAQQQATIFTGAFFATMEEEGLLAAVDALKPAWDELQSQVAELGGGVDFGGVGRLFEIAGSETFRPLVEGVLGLDEALQGLANTGYLTVDSFDAIQGQAGSAFEQLTAAGLTSEEALKQMGPLLNNLVQASNEYGFELDANTQSLIGQAQAAGVAFRVEPMQQVADTMLLVAELLGATEEQLAGVAGGFQNVGESAAGVGATVGEGLATVGDTMRSGGEMAAEGFIEPLRSQLTEMLPMHGEDAVNSIVEKFAEKGQESATGFIQPLIDGVSTQLPEAANVGAEGLKTALAGAGEETLSVLDPVKMELAEGLPGAAAEGAEQIKNAFGAASEGVKEGLTPVVDKFETEIKGAGETTSNVIKDAFTDANTQIEGGLTKIESVIGSGITGAADAAADAVLGIADAAKKAAEAAASIDFPSAPDYPGGNGGGGADKSAAAGWSGMIKRETDFTVHPGEMVNVFTAQQVAGMKNDHVSAQEGFGGGITVSFGDQNINLPAGAATRGEDGETRVSISLEDLKEALREDREGIVQEFRDVLFEQT